MQKTTLAAICPHHGIPSKRANCKGCNAAYMRTYLRRRRQASPETVMWERARRRAKKRGIEFSLSRSAIVIPRKCPALGVVLHIGGKRSDCSPSLDRIIPNVGYVAGNVRVICDRANRLKSNCTRGEIYLRSWRGPTESRAEYEKIAAYLDRELFLRDVRKRAACDGSEGKEWAKIADFLDRVFLRAEGRREVRPQLVVSPPKDFGDLA